MSVSTFATPAGSTDEGGTLVFSSDVLQSGSKVAATLTAGNYSATFYGSGSLSIYSYSGTSATLLTSVTSDGSGQGSASFPITGTPTGLAFSGANGTVVIRKFATAVSASISESAFPTGTTLPNSSFGYSGQSAYGNGIWVVLPDPGSASTVTTVSTDGKNWSAGTGRLPNTIWSDIAYGNGLFVAIAGWSFAGGSSSAGNTNIVATSTDGVTWTQRTMPVGAYWSRIIYANNQFLAISRNSSTAAATSPNGITWTQRTLPSASDWVDVTYGGDKYVALSASTVTATSTDGITWTAGSISTSGSWARIAWDGTNFVAIASYSTNTVKSTNGTTWTATGVGPNNGGSYQWYGLYAFNGKVYALSAPGSQSNYSVTSNSGTSWTAYIFPSGSANSPRSMMSDGSKYWIIQWNMLYSTVSSVEPTYSSMQFPMTNLAMKSIAYGNGRWVASYNSGVQNLYHSTDGVTWTSVFASPSFSATFTVYYFKGLFIAIASGGQNYLTSPDGLTWTSRTSSLLGSGTQWGFGAQSPDVLVIPALTSGYGGLGTRDGITWFGTIPTTTDSVAYTSGKFVSVKHTSTSLAWISGDGVNWSYSGQFPVSISASGVAAVNGLIYVFSGSAGYYSKDGSVWYATVGCPGVGGTAMISGKYVSSVPGSAFRVSSDGVVWNNVAISTYIYPGYNVASDGANTYWIDPNYGAMVSYKVNATIS